jgi:hypothetical protein
VTVARVIAKAMADAMRAAAGEAARVFIGGAIGASLLVPARRTR